MCLGNEFFEINIKRFDQNKKIFPMTGSNELSVIYPFLNFYSQRHAKTIVIYFVLIIQMILF